MSLNASHLLTVAEAAEALEVSDEQIRRYARSGLLPSVKIAGVWLVSGGHVEMLMHHPPTGGRPLSCSAAWEAILDNDFGDPDEITDPHLYRNRSTVSRWSSSGTQVQEMLRHPDIVIGGIHAGLLHGALLSPLVDEAQIYLSAATTVSEPDYERPCAGLVSNPLGGIMARVVPDVLWPHLLASSVSSDQAPDGLEMPSGQYAPFALAVLDLMESPHTRERTAIHDMQLNRRRHLCKK